MVSQKELVIAILQWYDQLEHSDIYQNEKPLYFTSSEFDEDNLTKFDILSNNFQIGLISKLNHIKSAVVLQLFKSLFDNNFMIFDSTSGEFLFYDQNLTKSDLNDMYDLNKTDKWIQVLEKYIDSTYDEIDELEGLDGVSYKSYGPVSIFENINNKINNQNQYLTIGQIIKKFN